MEQVARRGALVLLTAWLALIGHAGWHRVHAQDSAFQTIITSQMDAFRAGDAQTAWSFAAPSIRQRFGTPETFMRMVETGYPPVWRPQSVRFGALTDEMSGRPTQVVQIVDRTGRIWTALYAFEKQPDGSWKISGVVLKQTEAADV